MSKIPLNEFIILQRGFDLPSSKRIAGNVPVVASTGIAGYHNEIKVKAPGVVIGRSGSIGGGQYIEKDFFPLNTTLYVKDFKGHYPRFIYYLLKSIDFTSFNVGTGVPTLNRNHLSSILISDLGIDKEKEIANILGSLDAKIQLNTQINQTLEQIAQAIFKSWFVDFDPVRAKAAALRDSKTQAEAELAAMSAISGKTTEELTALEPERYAELAAIAAAFPSEMGEVDGVEVPRGWEVKRIDEVIKKIPVGKKYSSKTAFSEGLVPILDQGRSGVIGYHNDKAGVNASIEDPIIVFANHTCYMRLISYDFSAIQNVFAFKGKECNLYWLYLATLGKQEFVEYKGHFPDFLIKEIIVPPEELTELFGKYVKENFSKIFVNDKENSSLAKIRDLLLPRLLSGDL
ncbi:restriction endonuclease subunit S [Eikenella longinqua]|uniref:Restriction endonuclease subunit S n=1 Tax=Eikenella longinqua TaxID=1795827 RepID=A0A1A9S2L0_9NEIS|nr:restriction endonuclease subunit S [Eikenella longinqua]